MTPAKGGVPESEESRSAKGLEGGLRLPPKTDRRGLTEIPPCAHCLPWEDPGRNAQMWCTLTACKGRMEVSLGGKAVV